MGRGLTCGGWGLENQELSHAISGRDDRSLGVENVPEYQWACGEAANVPGIGGRAVLRARIDAQLRGRAVTGVGRRGAICFVCGRRFRRGSVCGEDARTDPRPPPFHWLMRTHRIEPRCGPDQPRLILFLNAASIRNLETASPLLMNQVKGVGIKNGHQLNQRANKLSYTVRP